MQMPTKSKGKNANTFWRADERWEKEKPEVAFCLASVK